MTEYGRPDGWKIQPLGEVVEILDRQRVPINAKERKKRQGNVPYYGATGQVGWIDDYLFDEELVLLGEDGAPFLDAGKPTAYMISGKAWVNNHAHVLRAGNDLNNAFLMHQLNRVDYHGFVSGTTRLKLTQAAMRKIPLLVPPLRVQQQIVDALDTQFTRLDAAVANLEHVQANLKRYRASVLKAAVEGRLVPTEAGLARQAGRDHEPASELLERILEERRRRWEEAELAKMAAKGKTPKNDKWKAKYKDPEGPDTEELPELPEGWCWATLDQITDVKLGKMLSKKAYIEGLEQHPYLRNLNVQWGTVDLSDLKEMGFKDAEMERYGVEPGDLLVCEGGEPGRCAVLQQIEPPLMFQKALHRVRPWMGEVDTRFLQLVLWHYCLNRVILPRMSETTIKHLPLEKMIALPVPVCPASEMDRIVEEGQSQLSDIDRLTVDMSSSIRRIGSLRQAVLAWAFSGRLSTSNSSQAV